MKFYTAVDFVSKLFCHANRYDPTPIRDEDVKSSSEWLKDYLATVDA